MPALALPALSSLLTDAVDDELIEANLASRSGARNAEVSFDKTPSDRLSSGGW
jgi:hypothetical protein